MRRFGKAAGFIGLITVGVAAYVVARPAAETKDASAKDATLAHALAELPKLPLTFEENRGQTDAAVKFVARGSGATMWLTGNAAVLGLSADGKAATDVLRMSFVGAGDPETSGVLPQKTKSSYLRGGGDDVLGVPHFAEVVSKDLYPGVDLRWHGDRGKLEYDLVVAPGADPSAVRMRFQGADSLALRDGGDLALSLSGREIVQTAPVAWQMNGATREPVAAAFEVAGEEVGFRLGAYDRSRELVVDPSIAFSTYIGGSGDESANGCAIDQFSNAVVVVGGTNSIDFPSGFGHIPTAPKGSTDAYVAKFNSTVSFVEWQVYLAGAEYDEAWGVAIDQTNGSAWITGQTFSANFPVINPVQAARAGKWDGFVTQIDEAGDHVMFSTYLGGSGDDFPRAITVGANVFVTGFTESNANFPTLLPAQAAYGGGAYDGFLTQYSSSFPYPIVRSTFIGGSGDDRAYDVATITGIASATQPGTVEPLTNGSFESDLTGWGTTDVTNPYLAIGARLDNDPLPTGFFLTDTTDGSKAVTHGWNGDAGSISLFQDLVIPPTSDLGSVTFDWRAGWCFTGTPRTFDVQILPSGGGAVQQTVNILTANPPAQTVLNFDAVPAPGSPVANFYPGVLFGPDFITDNPGTLHPTHPSHSGANNVATDGVAGGVFGNCTVLFSNPVCFEGAWYSGVSPVNQWTGYLNGIQVFQSGILGPSLTSVFFPSGYVGLVDRVDFFTLQGSGYLDDFTYRSAVGAGPTSSTVPFDLAPFAGTGCRLRFLWTVPQTNTGPAKFQLDNVRFYAAKGAVVVGGRTASSNFPRSNFFHPSGTTVQPGYGGGLADAFVVEYRRNGSAVNWSTTYGGTGEDTAQGVAIEPFGDVAFTGNTNSFDFPRVLALQPNRRGPDDAFLVKVRNGGYVLDFSTYYGGNGSDIANAVQMNPLTGDMYVVGTTSSSTLPLSPDALQGGISGGTNTDAFVARFGTIVNGFGINQPGFAKYASYLGGQGYEKGKNLELTTGSTLYVVGDTSSVLDFPLLAPFAGAISGPTDGFLSKMDVSSVLFPARDLVAEPRSPESVALAWTTEPTDAQSFLIERTSPTGVTTQVATVPTTVTEFVDTGLSPDTSYAYSVSAVDKDGVKDAANFVQTSTPPYPPAAPTGLTASASGAKVVLDWTDGSANETGFDVQRAVGGELKTIATVKAGATHFETTEIVSAATDSSWRVVAVNRGGSAGSNVVELSTEPTVAVQQLTGSLLDSAKSGGDRFTAAGRVTGLAGFDPNAQTLRIEVGDAATPVVLKIPAGDRGWTAKRGVLSWNSKRSFLGGARFTLELNAKKGTYSLSVTGFDFPAAPGASVSVGFALGDKAGATRTGWAVKAGGKLVLK